MQVFGPVLFIIFGRLRLSNSPLVILELVIFCYRHVPVLSIFKIDVARGVLVIRLHHALTYLRKPFSSHLFVVVKVLLP